MRKARKQSQDLVRFSRRVLQKNLVYLVGIIPELASESQLRRRECLGQYGQILKIAIKSQPYKSQEGLCYAAYVTFDNQNQAAACIVAVNGAKVRGRTLKATFGATKYCRFFLQGQSCPNRLFCSFLHKQTPQDKSRQDNLKEHDSDMQQALKLIGEYQFKWTDSTTIFPALKRCIGEESTSCGSTLQRTVPKKVKLVDLLETDDFVEMVVLLNAGKSVRSAFTWAN